MSIFFAGAQLGKVRPGFGPAWYTGDGVIYFHHTIGALVPMGTPRTLNLEVTYHEMAHALFSWWDLYSSTDSGGVGLYCLMSGGETEPSAYLRVKNGWPSVTEIAGPAEGLVVADDGGVYKYTNSADPREYYLIENRCRRDWNSFLPDEGLAIWHIDESMIGVPQVHRVVTLEQADGRFDLDRKANVGDSTDLYGGPDARQFSEVTVPSSRWWSGQSSGLIITNISDPGPVMTFDVRLVGDCDGDGVPDGQEIAAGAADCNANATPDSCEPDRDSDGAVDSCDNCRELANSDQSDGDGDGWGDACDACPGTIPGGAIIEGCPPGVPYDLDIDGDVDEDDLQQFEACAAGPGVLPADWLCGSLDIDLDGDIDQVEFAYLQRCWSGRDVLGDLDCWMP